MLHITNHPSGKGEKNHNGMWYHLTRVRNVYCKKHTHKQKTKQEINVVFFSLVAQRIIACLLSLSFRDGIVILFLIYTPL